MLFSYGTHHAPDTRGRLAAESRRGATNTTDPVFQLNVLRRIFCAGLLITRNVCGARVTCGARI